MIIQSCRYNDPIRRISMEIGQLIGPNGNLSRDVKNPHASVHQAITPSPDISHKIDAFFQLEH